MNKRFLVLVAVLTAFVGVAFAQPRAVGARIGYGIGVTYQHGFGEKNMISADLGFTGNIGLDAAVTYDWIFPIQSWQNKGTWNWFAGVGLDGGFWSNMRTISSAGESMRLGERSGWIGVAGRIGVEYNFWFPLQLAIDWRPVFGPQFTSTYTDDKPVVNETSFCTDGLYATAFTLSVRYRF